ncbi:MAG: cobyrinate a,c-diamide synthase [Oscillospiraceae bacterium]|nr:cobyrinate a,c-diamide synthase [Oscillospiraceae bacterium]
MKRLMVAAMHSGAGKTVVSCALMAALKARGHAVRAFKCGPDYIDPMFHSRVLGVDSRNLDLFLQGEAGVRRSLGRGGGEIAVLEAAMGYYDGLGGTDEASAWALARLMKTPVILVVKPGGSSLTLAAQICGLRDFRPESGLAGILLNDCSERRFVSLRAFLEAETGLPVLGYMPPMEQARIESRHLGLLTAGEIADLETRFLVLAAQMERSVDLDRLLALASEDETEPGPQPVAAPRCRIALARDEAFCFCYRDSLDALREAGAELAGFSPLHDAALPEGVDGLLLPGGYPELYARTLSENRTMRESVRRAVTGGLPTIAECGGFLYLQESLENETGEAFPMCGALPGRGFKTGRLQRFGYEILYAPEDSLLFRAGERIPAHEFHYWDSTANGGALLAEKADGRRWPCGFVSDSLYAAFPHLHLDGEAKLADRFVKACEAWKRLKNS